MIPNKVVGANQILEPKQGKIRELNEIHRLSPLIGLCVAW